jgi:hypothetical protein
LSLPILTTLSSCFRVNSSRPNSSNSSCLTTESSPGSSLFIHLTPKRTRAGTSCLNVNPFLNEWAQQETTPFVHEYLTGLCFDIGKRVFVYLNLYKNSVNKFPFLLLSSM